MPDKTILILGGGIGGQVAANRLRRLLGKQHRIVVIDRERIFTFSPSLLWMIVGAREPAQFSRDLNRLTRKGIEVVEAEVTAIDPATRRVSTSAGEFAGDYLIIALGAELAHDAVPGWKPAALNFYCLKGAEMTRSALASFQGGRLCIVVAATPYKCPAAPYEAAMLIADSFTSRGIKDKVDLHVYTPDPLPMPVAGPVLGNAVRRMLEAKGIGFHPNLKLERVEGDAHKLIFAGGESADFDLLLGVPPHRAPAVVRESSLVGEAGWIPVDAKTLRTRYERVYAIGDVTAIKLPVGKPLPKAGVFAHYEAEVVAENIAAELRGENPDHAFDGKGYCFLEIGSGRAGFAGGNFYAIPEPQITLRKPGSHWHWGKVLFERWWLSHWF
ncbi:MAG: NAD(P)/FAD-dependent oxidoreductase [Nitrospirae bacterium]|nr:NAD(P)/FAD-dependent oxidoreductase [Nitrospirota bacterium]